MVSSFFLEEKEEGTHELSPVENWAPNKSCQSITQLNAESSKPHDNERNLGGHSGNRPFKKAVQLEKQFILIKSARIAKSQWQQTSGLLARIDLGRIYVRRSVISHCCWKTLRRLLLGVTRIGPKDRLL